MRALRRFAFRRKTSLTSTNDVVKNSLKFVVAEDISTVLETALVIPNCNPKEKAPLKRRTTAKAKAEKKLPALTAN